MVGLAVLPGIQAAFVDIGTEKAGSSTSGRRTSHADDEDDDDGNGGTATANGRGRRARHAPPIQDPQEGPGDPGPGHQGADRHQGSPPHRARSRCRAGSSSTCPASSTSGSAGRSRAARSGAACAKMAEGDPPPDAAAASSCARWAKRSPRRRFEKEFERLHGTWQKIQRSAPRRSARRPGAPRGQADQRHHPRPVQRQVRRARWWTRRRSTTRSVST